MTISSVRPVTIVGVSAGALATTWVVWKYCQHERAKANAIAAESAKEASARARAIFEDYSQQQSITSASVGQHEAQSGVDFSEGIDIEIEMQQCDNFLLVLKRLRSAPQQSRTMALERIVREYQKKLQQPGWCTGREDAILALSDVLTELLMSDDSQELSAVPELDRLVSMFQKVMSSNTDSNDQSANQKSTSCGGGGCGGGGCGGGGCGSKQSAAPAQPAAQPQSSKGCGGGGCGSGGCGGGGCGSKKSTAPTPSSGTKMPFPMTLENRDKMIAYLVDENIKTLLAENVYLQYVPEQRKLTIKEQATAEVDRLLALAGQATAPNDKAPTCAPGGCGTCSNRSSCPSQAKADESASVTTIQEDGAVKINLS
eukprot:gnl/MRDRNA2_/MRDRNA2_72651_c0_seq1.p1 gnl/MRDRNA2_/MRDRNA2_72651_c0~~gnl/MRDRNA2_/MRDRNA2_72651_c0_seq1.p1  ORF type:complete len:371 (+),score=74.12 gnl/MRDRNA2_/MRDRNA2_72651_c0_seq1:109-1221(+)